MSRERTTLILPALNEGEIIARVVEELAGRADEILVVDNGSSDGTAELAAAAGARVVREPRRGYGAACWAGTCAAAPGVLCFADADGTSAPDDVSRVLAEVLAGRLDLAIGSRTLECSPAMRAHHRLVNRFLGAALLVTGSPRLTDIGCLRAIRRDALLALGMQDRAFAWPLEMVVRASRAGLRTGELPVACRARIGGQSKVSGSVRGSLRTARQMGVLLLREARR